MGQKTSCCLLVSGESVETEDEPGQPIKKTKSNFCSYLEVFVYLFSVNQDSFIPVILSGVIDSFTVRHITDHDQIFIAAWDYMPWSYLVKNDVESMKEYEKSIALELGLFPHWNYYSLTKSLAVKTHFECDQNWSRHDRRSFIYTMSTATPNSMNQGLTEKDLADPELFFERKLAFFPPCNPWGKKYSQQIRLVQWVGPAGCFQQSTTLTNNLKKASMD